jgi:hypothetical protein
MVDGGGRLDEFFGLGEWFEILDREAEESRVHCDGRSGIEVVVVGGAPKRGSQIGELEGEPVVGLPLAGAIPQGEDGSATPPEVEGVGSSRLVCLTPCDELLVRELANGLQHRIPCPVRGPIDDEQRLANQGVQQVQDGEFVGLVGRTDRAGTFEVKPTGEDRRMSRGALPNCGFTVLAALDTE